MLYASKKITKITNMDSLDFSLITGFIIALMLMPLILLNIEKIETTFHIPKYEEVNEVCLTPTCLFPLKLDKPELKETRPGTVLIFFVTGILFFSLISYFIHYYIVNKI